MPSLFLQALQFGNISLFPLPEALNTLFSQPSPSETLSVGPFYREEHGNNEIQALSTLCRVESPGCSQCILFLQVSTLRQGKQ